MQGADGLPAEASSESPRFFAFTGRIIFFYGFLFCLVLIMSQNAFDLLLVPAGRESVFNDCHVSFSSSGAELLQAPPASVVQPFSVAIVRRLAGPPQALTAP
jgi:hypothetical protein